MHVDLVLRPLVVPQKKPAESLHKSSQHATLFPIVKMSDDACSSIAQHLAVAREEACRRLAQSKLSISMHATLFLSVKVADSACSSVAPDSAVAQEVVCKQA